jgi:hypothetical protein
MSNTPWLATALLAANFASLCAAEAPVTSDPSARLIAGFDMPGEYPTTVTSANINITPEPGVVHDGAGEDSIKLEFPSAGPIAWTVSRNNSGDMALLVGPADPENPAYFPPTGTFLNNYQALNGNTAPINPSATPTELTTLAWRVSNLTGASFATPRRNVYHSDETQGYTASLGGAPIGDMYGVAYIANTLGQGWGFRMEDGVFANGGGNSVDLTTGFAGASNGKEEASFDVATVYLPYEQGWQGAWVLSAADGPATFDGSSEGLNASTVNWTAGQADVSLPGVDSASDGMLFVAPANGSSNTRLASAFPNAAGGWTTTVRLDSDADTTGQTFLNSGNDFQFLYVPYDTTNLIGAFVEGSNGSLKGSGGADNFSLTRTSTGDYALSVFEDDLTTKKTEDAGMLMLSAADTVDGGSNTTLGSRAFLSYEYDAMSGDFIIQARELESLSGGSANTYGELFSFVDTDFYFAWVDFADPFSPAAGLTGDYNNDGFVNAADYTVWRDGLPAADGNGDGTVDAADYVLWSDNYGAGVAPSSVAVPEPAAIALLAMLLGAAAIRRA